MIGSIGGVAILLKALRDHPSDVQVQRQACGALGTLVDDASNRFILISMAGVHEIVVALKVHSADREVQYHCCAALITISEGPDLPVIAAASLGWLAFTMCGASFTWPSSYLYY
eukprot:gnl/TRDRNA2_/TRDRNA2_168864_c0_seq1.p1 gnl/TRDRNA2_/TRDRNA2_168864_c0~~gnl/TRDRNA2_/TRDRNA2_168864_c0_seq1.p1  ORF type:complete len:114 (-),score=19.19 gnl/TRDRNA2_/TRDRNA2_168864_c0_seq1:220-561(-)